MSKGPDEPAAAGDPALAVAPVTLKKDEPVTAQPVDGAPSDEAAVRKPSKAERLEAKAARLREADERRAAEREAAGTGEARPNPRLVVAVVALGVLAAALVAVLIVGFLSWRHQRDVDSARTSALKAARTFAVDFGSYDYQHLDAEFSEVAKRMTAGFAKNYTETSGRLKPTLIQYKTKVTATVQGSGVTSVNTSTATVVVFLDQKVITSQSTVPRIDRNRLQIQLRRQGGKWLVANMLAK